MSILKQMEDARLTPEEVRELIELLDSALPKIERRAAQEKSQNVLSRNLDEFLSKANFESEGEVLPPKPKKMEVTEGLAKLKSARTKLGQFIKAIEE